MTTLRITGKAETDARPCIRCGTPERNHYGSLHPFEVRQLCFSCKQVPASIVVKEGAVCGACAMAEEGPA